MSKGEVCKYPGDDELGQLCKELGMTVRAVIQSCEKWNPDKYYRRRRTYKRVPADFAVALADLTKRLPGGPVLSREDVLRRLRII
jgi:hypothetical protein